MAPIRVLLADDHPIVRSGIRDCLNKDPDILLIGEAENGRAALQMARDMLPDVLILDVELPELTGIEVAQCICNENLPVRILVLSAYDEPVYIQSLLSMGVFGYLIKEEATLEIVNAVHGVARGEGGWISRQVSARLSTLFQEDSHRPLGLTTREVEVLNELVTGKTNQEIAIALFISEKTVEKHLETIFKKMKVTSRVEAAVITVREGIGNKE